ncbi:hypothetical protein GGF32_006716 [Allomyces javanicus]|nr:hypothetical protein GGF32_006716 [Allomyces javanicus]
MVEIKFVVAIDFGTSHSGFAYVHKGAPDDITAIYDWDFGPTPYAKTLTAILYDGDLNPVTFGYAARAKFAGLKREQRAKHQYLTRFKLYLDEQFERENPPISHEDGAVVVIGDFLRFMFEKVCSVLQDKFAEFRPESVHWALTVPAMWSDRAKHYMRKAASYAGIVDEPNSTRLSIILEPEAAALFVSSKVSEGRLKHDDVFMILDAGGGTVDLTAHRVKEENGRQLFCEVAPGVGRSCGSTFVDDNFVAFFKSKVGADAYDRANAVAPDKVLGILTKFESMKRSFSGDDHDAEYQIEIPNAVQKEMSAADVNKLEEEQEGYADDVKVSAADMKSFFDPVVADIQHLVDEMLKRCKDVGVPVTKILCVGGFSESRYLIRAVRARYEPQDLSVICPADPGAIVVKGAVQFGLDPKSIASRRMRRTYGLAVRGYWDDSYPEAKRTWDRYQSTYMVEDKFDKLVTIGQEVSADFVARRQYYPPAIWAQSIRLSLYCSDEPDPRFVDDPGCSQLVEISIPLQLDQSGSINDYPISITVSFGASEIKISAINQKTGERFSHTVNYDAARAVAAAGTAGADNDPAPEIGDKRARDSGGNGGDAAKRVRMQ